MAEKMPFQVNVSTTFDTYCMFREPFCVLEAGYKEIKFSSLPFGQAVAKMY